MVPLAPLTVGDILGGGFSALGRNLKPLVAMAAAILLSAGLLTGAAFGIAAYTVFDHLRTLFDLPAGESADSADVIPVLGAFGGAGLASLLVFVVTLALMNAACLVVVQDAVLGRRPSFGEVWRRASPRIPAMLGTQLLYSLIVAVPLLLVGLVAFLTGTVADSDGTSLGTAFAVFLIGMLALWPLATWLYVRYSLAPAAVVFEKQGPVGALRRSAELVRGAWWRTFGIQLLVMVIAGVIGYFASMPFSYGGVFVSLAMMPGGDPAGGELVVPLAALGVLYVLGMVVHQFITTVLPQLSVGLLYVDRRIRVENLAPALAEAAGVQPPPPPYPGQPYGGEPHPAQSPQSPYGQPYTG
ncbi:DUF7847 domain-containing protein [Streptomyces sp. O3]